MYGWKVLGAQKLKKKNLKLKTTVLYLKAFMVFTLSLEDLISI